MGARFTSVDDLCRFTLLNFVVNKSIEIVEFTGIWKCRGFSRHTSMSDNCIQFTELSIVLLLLLGTGETLGAHHRQLLLSA